MPAGCIVAKITAERQVKSLLCLNDCLVPLCVTAAEIGERMRVLVPIEDPLFAACIVQFIAQHEWPERTEFLVMHVIDPYYLRNTYRPSLSALLESSDKVMVERATKLVNAVAQAIPLPS